MDMRNPPFKLKIMLESNPLKFRILVWRLAVPAKAPPCAAAAARGAPLAALAMAASCHLKVVEIIFTCIKIP